MKVLFVVPKFPHPVKGGLEKQSFELASELARKGVNISVFSAFFSKDQKSFEITHDGVKVYRPDWLIYDNKQGGRAKFSTRVSILFKLKKYLRSLGAFDLVHIHSNSFLTGKVLKYYINSGTPVLSKIPNTGNQGVRKMLNSIKGRIRLKLLLMSDAIIAMTRETIKELESVNYPVNRIIKIPNGINIQGHLGLKKTYFDKVSNVTFVGRLKEQKGIEVLLKAWKIVVEKYSEPILLNIYGDGPLKHDLEKQARLFGIEKTVIFHGYTSNILEELKKADLFVLPSREEGNSNAILEAMLMKTPIVSTKISGTNLQVGNLGGRYLFDPGDYKMLANKMMILIESRLLREELGEFLFYRLNSEFRMDKIALKYIEAYDFLLKKDYRGILDINQHLFSEK